MLGLRCKGIENLLSLVGTTSSLIQCCLYDASVSRWLNNTFLWQRYALKLLVIIMQRRKTLAISAIVAPSLRRKSSRTRRPLRSFYLAFLSNRSDECARDDEQKRN